MSTSVRRVVTANDEEGRSYFLIDGPAGNLMEQPGRGLTFHELWATDGPLASNVGTEDAGARPVEHHPTPGGTRLRIVEFLPDEAQRADLADEDFAQLKADKIRTGDSDDPTMHRNETVDYNIILRGEIYAKTDAGEVLIQRGTAHTWHNRSDTPCVFASIMVSAEPLAQFS